MESVKNCRHCLNQHYLYRVIRKLPRLQPVKRLLLSLSLILTAIGASAEAPLIYGFMASSDEWRDLQDQAYEQYGWYTFRADGSTPITPVSPISPDQEWALYGGVYVNGVYYGYSVNGNYLNYTLSFHGINATDWSTVVAKSFQYKKSESSSEESQRAALVPSDMVYDPLGDVVYASTRRFMSDTQPTLCTVDLTTGILTPIGSIPNLCALTCDQAGQLWGISVEDASLYKIGKDASSEKVGETGFYPFRDSERTQSAAFDYASGKIYWSFYGFSNATDRNYNRNAVFAMLSVDTTTGKA